jgi:hypothetical protein
MRKCYWATPYDLKLEISDFETKKLWLRGTCNVYQSFPPKRGMQARCRPSAESEKARRSGEPFLRGRCVWRISFHARATHPRLLLSRARVGATKTVRLPGNRPGTNEDQIKREARWGASLPHTRPMPAGITFSVLLSDAERKGCCQDGQVNHPAPERQHSNSIRPVVRAQRRFVT